MSHVMASVEKVVLKRKSIRYRTRLFAGLDVLLNVTDRFMAKLTVVEARTAMMFDWAIPTFVNIQSD